MTWTVSSLSVVACNSAGGPGKGRRYESCSNESISMQSFTVGRPVLLL